MEVLQNILVYLGSFVLVLSVVVFVHELGHFQVARWRGVAIDTFSIGFGKTLFGWRDKQGVQWKVGALPLGGYVKFTDDVDAMSTAPAEKIEDPVALAEARAKGLFHAQSLTTRALVVAAGPVSNFVFAILAFSVHIMATGRDLTDYSTVPVLIHKVEAGSAAEAAGFRRGEVIDAINGEQIRGSTNFYNRIGASAGQELRITVITPEGGTRVVAATPREITRPNGELAGALGIRMSARREDQTIQPVGFGEAFQHGFVQTWTIIASTVDYIAGIFTGRNSGRDIAGPLGILNVSGQVATAAMEVPSTVPGGPIAALVVSLLGLAAVLSVAVGFVNLLPIPILDGGHLLFYGIEALRGGRPLPANAQEWAYRAGFAVMGSLFLFATWNDITRLFPGAQ